MQSVGRIGIVEHPIVVAVVVPNAVGGLYVGPCNHPYAVFLQILYDGNRLWILNRVEELRVEMGFVRNIDPCNA